MVPCLFPHCSPCEGKFLSCKYCTIKAVCQSTTEHPSSEPMTRPSVPSGAERGDTSMQVMAMGTPVVSLSLSPAMEMLATAHINRRGIYLWANQLVFGVGTSITPSDIPVKVRTMC